MEMKSKVYAIQAKALVKSWHICKWEIFPLWRLCNKSNETVPNRLKRRRKVFKGS